MSRVPERAQRTSPRVLYLFDVDGTLTAPRQRVTDEVLQVLEQARKHVVIGVVGGSDFAKQREQLGDDVLERFDYSFSENGLLAFEDGVQVHERSLVDELGEVRIKEFVNFVLAYVATLYVPVKRGTFIEFRTGMINVSPIGRNCSQAERDAFEAFDRDHHVRERMVRVLRERFSGWNLQFSIGGQISFDVFPKGWDKTYCLRHIAADAYDEIHFFGDKTAPGGNDHEMYESARTIGHAVASPDDTCLILQELQATHGAH